MTVIAMSHCSTLSLREKLSLKSPGSGDPCAQNRELLLLTSDRPHHITLILVILAMSPRGSDVVGWPETQPVNTLAVPGAT